MNKLTKKASCALLAVIVSIFSTTTTIAQTTADTNLCQNAGVVFAFFNGVLTTPWDADRAKEAFINIHGKTSAKGDKIQYEVLYNHTNGFEDFVETFAQRLKEQDELLNGCFELFFESLKGGGSWWSEIINAAHTP